LVVSESLPVTLIPRLSTARLLLREPRLTDFDAFAAHLADPVASSASGYPVRDRREAWRWFHSAAGHWLLQGIGSWVVEEKDLGVIGSVGAFLRESGPPLEMSWLIYRQHWSKGYASEAAAAALAFAVGTFGADRVNACMSKTNRASARVAAKIGMQFRGETDFYGEPSWLYVCDARSWVPSSLT
jgi:RimJ/RimL family protein N-acetyltransferase